MRLFIEHGPDLQTFLRRSCEKVTTRKFLGKKLGKVLIYENVSSGRLRHPLGHLDVMIR